MYTNYFFFRSFVNSVFADILHVLVVFLTSQCSNITSGMSPDMCLIHDYVNFSCYAIYLLFVLREFLKTFLPMHLSDIAFYGDLQIICGETILLAVFLMNLTCITPIWFMIWFFSLYLYFPFCIMYPSQMINLYYCIFFHLLLMSTSSIV